MDAETLETVEFNQEVRIRIYVESSSIQIISVNFNIRDDKKVNIVGCNFPLISQEFLTTEVEGQYLVEYCVRLPLQDGNYSIRAQITSLVASDDTAVFIDVVDDAVVFQMARWNVARVWSKVHLFPTFQIQKIYPYD
jgi:lipopolysaccharide transport system ATP-binding protein